LTNSPTMSMLIGEEAEALIRERQGAAAEELKRCRQQQEKLEDRLTKLATAFTDGLMGAEQFQRVSEQWRAQQEELRERTRAAEYQLSHGDADRVLLGRVWDTVRTLAQTWESLPMPELRDFLAQVVEHMKIARDGHDRLLRVKLLLLPEQEIRIPSVHRRADTSDPATQLTLQELSIVAGLAKGLNNRQIADRLRSTSTSVANMLARARREVGVATTRELVEVCRPVSRRQRPPWPCSRSAGIAGSATMTCRPAREALTPQRHHVVSDGRCPPG
jgi:hypothetical protein